MKEAAISHDLVQQQHLWNTQHRHQPQNHNNAIYSNQSTQQQGHQHGAGGQQSQRSAMGHQQNQHPASHIGQYHHQPLQSTAHQGPAAAAAAYYQQAHLYPAYQTHAHSQDQHHTSSDQQHGQHHHSNVAGPGATSGSVNTGVHAVTGQHGGSHHQQNTSDTQTSALNHGWSPSVGSIATQPHHAVVTDPSSLAYMAHAYQNHSNSVNDHHRTSNGPMSAQAVSSAHQASTYSVDTLYNTPAAAAAVAAYGYNNYNPAFFQTSNGTQTGHPTQANMSTFWNHNQTAQQRSNHSQVTNQANVDQRQNLGSEQASNYMHDPRMYYSRSPYNQAIQNFNQHHSQSQAQPDILHHRIGAITQQHQLLHHDQHLSPVPQSNLHHQASGGQPNQPALGLAQQSVANQHNQSLQHHNQQNRNIPNQSNSPPNLSQDQRLLTTSKSLTHNPSQKQLGSDLDPNKSTTQKSSSEFDQIPTNCAPVQASPSPQKTTQQQHVQIAKETDESRKNGPHTTSISSRTNQQPGGGPNQSITHSQSVIKNEMSPNFRRLTQNQSSRLNFHGHLDDHKETPTKNTETITTEQKLDTSQSEARIPHGSTTSRSTEQPSSLEDSLASLTVSGPKRNTWASIASQPAKVAQPKSLKSKMSGTGSVLSSSKNLVAVSLDATNMDSKNGINPVIKSSVSAAATSIQRSSVPPPVSKVASIVPSLKLDLLGLDNLDSSKISWPAVNASANLTLDDPPLKESSSNNMNTKTSHPNISNDVSFRDRNRSDVMEHRRGENMYRDHNHNHSGRMNNSYQSGPTGGRDNWSRRGDTRGISGDFRSRRDSDHHRDSENDRPSNDQPHNGFRADLFRDPPEGGLIRRDFKQMPGPRGNNQRDDFFRDRPEFPRRGPAFGNDHRSGDFNRNSRSPIGRGFESRGERALFAKHNYIDRDQTRGPGNNTSIGPNDNTGVTRPISTRLNPEDFNPKTFDLEPVNARYFIIKSYSEDDIHRSIKYAIWCSTNHGNRRLDEAFRHQQAKEGPLFLLFSVNGSGHFCGMAQMTSTVDFDSSSGVWAQSKWQGEFSVKWIYVKDVPNGALRHITLENNEDKPVTNSRDTQEVPFEKGKAVLKILHNYNHTTSLFDDFLHYERRQEEGGKFKKPAQPLDHPSDVRGVDHRLENESSREREHRSDRPRDRERPERIPGGRARFGNRPFVNSRPHDYHGNRDRQPRFAP